MQAEEASSAAADHLYQARAAMADVVPQRRRFAFAELVQAIEVPGTARNASRWRHFTLSEQLRADYHALLRSRAMTELPVVAAAATDRLGRRMFRGGSVRLEASQRAGQYYLVIEFDQPRELPRSLHLETVVGDTVICPLPAGDAMGRVLILLTRSNADDAAVLDAISDPSSKGWFLL